MAWMSWRLTTVGQAPQLLQDHADALSAVAPLRDAQVLVQMQFMGMCHSDIHVKEGYFDQGDGKKTLIAPSFITNRTLGHEPMGVVVAVGPQASDVKVGDRVVVYPWIGCGNCRFCKQDEEHLCMRPHAMGVYTDGAFSTHTLVPHSRYCIEIGSADPRFGAICACSGLTAFGAIKKWGQVPNSARVLICGAGGLGFMALSIFKVLFPAHPGPVLMDIADDKLEAAKRAGLCSDTINPKTQFDKVQKVMAASALLHGFDYAADFVGSGATVEMLYRMMNKGGHLVIVGLFGGNFKISPAIIPLRVLTVSGTYVGTLRELRELLDMVKAHKLQAPPIDQRPFTDLPQALDDLHKGRVLGRIVLAATPAAASL